VYRQSDVKAILCNCLHQVWYPPQDIETAQMISTVFGSRIELAPSTYTSGGSWVPGAGTSTRYRPALEEAQAMSLPEGAVVAISMGLRFIGQRLDPRISLPQAPEPPTMPKHEPDPLVSKAFQKRDRDQEEVRRLTEQIRKAIEGEEGGG